MRLPVGAKRVTSWYLWLLLGIGIFLLPIVTLILNLLAPPTDTILFLWENRLPRQLLVTLVVCVVTALVTMLIGSTYGWLIARYRFPGASLFEWLLLMPLAIPTYVMAYCLRGFFDYAGPLALLYEKLHIAYPLAYLPIQGLGAALIVLILSLYPYVYIIARHSFRAQSRTLLEAGEVYGGERLFVRIGLPLARPALIGAGALVIMETLNEYGALFYLGVDTITTAIFGAWFNYNDIDSAAQISSYTFIIVFIIAALEIRSRHLARYNYGLAQWSPIHYTHLAGSKKWLATLSCALPVACGFVMPLIVLFFWTFAGDSALVWSPDLLKAAGQSLWLGISAALLSLLCALLIAYGRRIINRPIISYLVLSISLGYALPGAVVAVGLMRSISYLLPLGGIWILIYGYLFRHLAVCYHPINAGLEQFCGNVDDAAYVLGASHLQRLLRISIPQIRYTLIAATLLVFLDVLRELPLTIILRPLGLQTLALESFYYMSEEQRTLAALPALLMVIIATVVVLIIEYCTHGQRSSTRYSESQ